MAVYFEGTSTGKRYEVGKPYEMNGSVYRAQADGSFVNEGKIVTTTDQGRVITDTSGRGQTLRGSAGNPDVSWYASGGSTLGTGSYSPGSAVSGSAAGGSHSAAVAAASDKDAPGGTSRIANPMLSPHKASSAAFVRAAAWSGKDDPAQDNLFGGFHLMANPKTTNAELWEGRYGDFGSSVIGIGVLAHDIGYTAARNVFGPNVDKMSPSQRVNALQTMGADALPDLGSALIGWGVDMGSMITSAANDRKVWEGQRDQARQSVDEAYALRDQLEFIEAQKAFDRSGMPEHMRMGVLGLPQDWPVAVGGGGEAYQPSVGQKQWPAW